ncbi:5'-3'-deoxyribonucleotidase [Enterococcus sp. 669A]|uniref:5'-3'-deoxyribonucleotidase n=1 Tax=Candidatus Enterococcus moelleringii TaxID=2815325 RepID=A0ABS3LBV4_9ENTE|nr:5'-3'-deoxyribonucleotidase [Enterococcus sp. 669A]MBO1307117.1 5'-3'-deoxyribonucleotidase [Enterococcus sp. 669A]
MVRIAVDMDEVIADYVAKELQVYNQRFGTEYTKADLQGRKLRHLHPEHTGAIRAFIREEDHFADFAVIEGAQEGLRKLAEKHEVYIATAAMEVPTCFNAKYAWLQTHFAFIPDDNYVFCGDKSIIAADYLIDDHIRHLETFKGTGILFGAPHNYNETYDIKLNNWQEVVDFFEARYGS